MHPNSPRFASVSSLPDVFREALKRQRRKNWKRHQRRLAFEELEDRRVMTVDWRNPLDALDVSGDGVISPLDALQNACSPLS